MKYSRLFALISFLLPLFSKVVLSDSNNSSAAEKQRKISSPIEIHLSTVQVPRSFFVQQDSDMFIWPQLPNETKFLLTNESDSSVPLSTVVGMRLGTIGIGIPRIFDLLCLKRSLNLQLWLQNIESNFLCT